VVSYIGNNIRPKGVGLIPPSKVIDGGYRTIIGNGSGLFSVPFITEWTVAGDATARTITLPLVSGYIYNCVVDWGDGTTPSLVTAYNDVNRIHTYSSDGTYNVGISGICQGWSFNNGGDKLKITDIIDYGSAPTFGGFKYLGGGFYGCANLKSLGPSNSIIPDDGLLDISSCFRGSGVSGQIPSNLIRQLTSATSIHYLLYGCSGLTGSIPTDLLRYVTSATSLHFLLYGCSGLTGSIPTDLLRYVTSATSLNYLLYGCSGLTGSIPTDLLRYVTSATNLNSLLRGCSGLTGSVPTDFLRYVTNAIYLHYLLYGCSGLTGSIPTDLLRYVTSATNLSYLFFNCSGLTGYDADLCRENVLCTDFSYMMYGCTAMQQRSDTFYRSGEESTRFLNQSPNFTSCFERDSFTGTQGTAPDLWNCSFGTGTPTTTGCWAGAGNSVASLTNYASIPVAWGGPA